MLFESNGVNGPRPLIQEGLPVTVFPYVTHKLPTQLNIDHFPP